MHLISWFFLTNIVECQGKLLTTLQVPILLPNFLGWQKTTLITSKMFGEDFFCIKLQPILSVHHTHIMHDTMSKEYAL